MKRAWKEPVTVVLVLLGGLVLLISGTNYVTKPDEPPEEYPDVWLGALTEVSQAIDRVNESAEMLMLKEAAWEDSALAFEGQDNWGIYATFSDTEIIIGHPPLVVIDMETGQAILHGDPNEAARLFWQAVERIRGMRP